MFLDASAIVALIDRESDAAALGDRLDQAESRRYLSAVTRFEAVIAIARNRTRTIGGMRPDAAAIEQAQRSVDAFVEDMDVGEIHITPEIARLALKAAATYGKFCGHPARLNFGDCFSYACAKTLGVPLLYKGDDFAKTDLA